MKNLLRHLFIMLMIGTLLSCSGGDSPFSSSYLEKGDLKAISSHDTLRVLIPAYTQDQTFLPRNGTPNQRELELLKAYAEQLNLDIEEIIIDNFADLIPALNEGRGDIIAANFTLTKNRKELIAFSLPIEVIEERLVTKKDSPLKTLADIKNRSISVRRSTSFWQHATELQKKYPKLQIKPLDEAITPDDKIDQINAGKIDVSVFDSNILSTLRGYRDDFSSSVILKKDQVISFGLRKANSEFLLSLNNFIKAYKLTQLDHKIFKGDFETIKKRKVIRFVTRNNAASYFVYRGQLQGFEYELAKQFAKKHNLRLEISVAETQQALLDALKDGSADIAASFLTPLQSRIDQGIAFSRSYHKTYEVVVAQKDLKIATENDLNDKTFAIRESSSYFETLNILKQKGIDFDVIKVPENEETQTIIEKIAKGDYQATIADSHIVAIEQTWLENIESKLNLGTEINHGWAVRTEDKLLLNAINQFIKKEYRSTFYNITYNKYFKSKNKIKKFKDPVNSDGRLSPYDDLVKKYATQYGFNWQLLTAQMHQESRFNPKAKSWVGAQGLMQVMPRTAKHMKITGNLQDPETGVKAGVKYLKWLGERFEDSLTVTDKFWFSLASYNAGAGHVKDARRLAKQKGWNPNIWFNNVEKAMLLLAQKKYSKKARHGYVRGTEPVNYVRSIREKFRAYTEMSQ